MYRTLTLPHLQFQSPPSTFPRRSPARPLVVHCRAEPANAGNSPPLPPLPSLYELLRVKRTASTTEIKAAYRSLAKLYHPDASDRPDGLDFIEIHRAYEILSNPASRSIYDVSIGVGGRVGRLTSASFGCDSLMRRRRPGFYTTRRWETDQCW